MKYRLVMFDFDGTLADSFAWFLGVLDELAVKYKFKRLSSEELESLRSESAATVLARTGVSRWKLPSIGRHIHKLAARDAERIQLFPGVAEMLRLLDERGAILSIVSSSKEANIRRILGEENAARIRFWEGGAALFGKRTRIRRVLRKAGVKPAEALYVGDEVRDLEAARAEGVAFGAVSWGFTRFETLQSHQPEAAFATADELTKFVVGF